jgi:hypothetical protein
LTVRELVRAMLAKRGVSDPTSKQPPQITAAAQRSLMGRDGRSVARVAEDVPARWAIRDQTASAA